MHRTIFRCITYSVGTAVLTDLVDLRITRTHSVTSPSVCAGTSVCSACRRAPVCAPRAAVYQCVTACVLCFSVCSACRRVPVCDRVCPLFQGVEHQRLSQSDGAGALHRAGGAGLLGGVLTAVPPADHRDEAAAAVHAALLTAAGSLTEGRRSGFFGSPRSCSGSPAGSPRFRGGSLGLCRGAGGQSQTSQRGYGRGGSGATWPALLSV